MPNIYDDCKIDNQIQANVHVLHLMYSAREGDVIRRAVVNDNLRVALL